MKLEDIMQYDNFVVVGNTINPDKYAYKIKQKLIDSGYNVESVGKEKKSINDVYFEIDVVDLCINKAVGIELLKENKKEIKAVLIQPGAESDEIKEYLTKSKIPFVEGCALVGCSLFKKER